MTHALKVAAVVGAIAFGLSAPGTAPARAQGKPDIKLGLIAGL